MSGMPINMDHTSSVMLDHADRFMPARGFFFTKLFRHEGRVGGALQPVKDRIVEDSRGDAGGIGAVARAGIDFRDPRAGLVSAKELLSEDGERPAVPPANQKPVPPSSQLIDVGQNVGR